MEREREGGRLGSESDVVFLPSHQMMSSPFSLSLHIAVAALSIRCHHGDSRCILPRTSHATKPPSWPGALGRQVAGPMADEQSGARRKSADRRWSC